MQNHLKINLKGNQKYQKDQKVKRNDSVVGEIPAGTEGTIVEVLEFNTLFNTFPYLVQWNGFIGTRVTIETAIDKSN